MPKRPGLVIDLDRCTGCGACQAACRLSANTPPDPGSWGRSAGVPDAFAEPSASPGPEPERERGTDWLPLRLAENGLRFPHGDAALVPVPCQHCDRPPCVRACPVGATGKSRETGVVYQVEARCIGCRACLAACPYQARVFTWTAPAWPGELGRAVTPFATARGRGVASKCDLCFARRFPGEAGWSPACVEACPARAMVFGDMEDPQSLAAQLAAEPRAFRLVASGDGAIPWSAPDPGPRVVYLSRRDWLRDWAARGGR